jgi:hypothetical protein
VHHAITTEQATRVVHASARPGTVALLLIIALGASLRCISLTAPLLDMHGQRQIDTATMTRYFVEDRFNPFYPQVSWGGLHGYVESEFPVLPIAATGLYELFGESDTWGRLLAVFFSTAALWAMYALGRELFGPAEGRAAAFLLAVSPTAVYYGRTYMPEAPMICFAIFGVLYFVRYFRTGSRLTLWAAAAFSALAWLAKLPAVITLAPIAAAAWRSRRWRVLRDRELFVAIGIALAATVAWYWHASAIYHATGLTVGMHPPKSYPLSIAEGPWEGHASKWSTLALLEDGSFYDTLFRWLFFLHLTPAGFAVAAVGALLCRYPARLVADGWVLAMIAFVVATAEVNRWHDYYQLLIVPPAALYFGSLAGPLFDGEWIRSRGPFRRGGAWAMGAALALIAGTTFYFSSVLYTHFRLTGAAEVASSGAAVGAATGHAEPIIVIDGYGVNSPYFLYYAHARGWSFDVPSISPFVIDRLHLRGAQYFATTRWTDLRRGSPAVAEYLSAYRQVPVPNVPRETVVFDLNQRAE